MTDLTTINDKPLARTTSDECSPGLWRRLTSANLTWADAIRDLAEDPAARMELVVVNARLQRHVEPCGGKFVAQTLAPLLALYGVPKKSEAEARTFWGFYIEALEGLPREAVAAGVAEYVRDPKSEFFPKPGPLRAICERHAIPLRMAANRARKALEAK
jgi:hypothetical protein